MKPERADSIIDNLERLSDESLRVLRDNFPQFSLIAHLILVDRALEDPIPPKQARLGNPDE